MNLFKKVSDKENVFWVVKIRISSRKHFLDHSSLAYSVVEDIEDPSISVFS